MNQEQKRASLPEGGVSLVLAGAGTGKTSTLVAKARAVMGAICRPEQMLILTFSRKAAEELRTRISAGFGEEAQDIHAATFHSFCLELLQSYPEDTRAIGGPDGAIQILDDEERSVLLQDIIMPAIGDFKGLPAWLVGEYVRSYESLDAWTRRILSRAGLLDAIRGIAERFREIKRTRNLVDYDDMMRLAVRMLQDRPKVREAALDRYRFLFVDEFQDTAADNLTLIKLLLPASGGNLFAVGDDWQSIYGFRGAQVRYILSFRRYFPGASVYRLTRNYRSRSEIIRFAVRFARKNRSRTRKKLVSARGPGGWVEAVLAKGVEDEADILRTILLRKAWGTTAVLYRNHRQGEEMKALLGAEFPHVPFMTMHASKGLEFDTVVVIGVADGIIPDPDADIEEERRLLFVACTRARERLFVIGRSDERGRPGRFARELSCSWPGDDVGYRAA